jgi:phosphopantetheinyl transferase (holo-ACP synthase)
MLQVFTLALAQTEREAARLQVRAACAQQLRAHYGGHWQAGDISNTRGQAPQLRLTAKNDLDTNSCVIASAAKQSTSTTTTTGGLPRRYAPRNDEAIKRPAQPAKPTKPNHLALSFSYEGPWAAYAWQEDAAIGIDLFSLAPADWQGQPAHWRQVAHDYLGAAARQRIFALPPVEQARAFAQAWAGHEAALKCLGQPLQEWQASLQTAMADMETGLSPLPPQLAQDSQRIWVLAWALPKNRFL